MQNIADLQDPNDPQGRTYREVNNSTSHSFSCGDLVEIDRGVRLIITRLSRDCDGTPLYCLGVNSGNTKAFGYPENGMILINAQ